MHWADYLVLVVYLLGTLGIGLYKAITGWKNKTTEEFIMANRQLKTLPAAISLVVSQVSGIAVLSNPAEMYTRGIMYSIMVVVVDFITTNIIAQIIIPWLYPLKLTSINTFLQMRYGRPVITKIASVVGMVNLTVWSAVAIYAPSLAFKTVTDVSVYISVPVAVGVCIIFTSLGGMRAVIWTDVFQSVIMLCGILTILIKAVIKVGGLSDLFPIMKAEGRLQFDWMPDPTIRHTLIGFLIGKQIMDITEGFSQCHTQRYYAVPTLKQAKCLPYLSFVGFALIDGLTHVTGIVLVAYFAKKMCDPLASGQISNPNQILPLFVMEVFQDAPGFLGLFIATLYSSSISTVSTNLSACSANVLVDFIKPKFMHLSDSRATVLSKFFVLLFGIITILVAFLLQGVKGPFVQILLSAFGLLRAPLFAFFIIGAFRICKKINFNGVLVGCVLGFALTLWLFLGSMTVPEAHPPLPPVSVEGCDVPVNVTEPKLPHLVGLQRFYSVSYQWYFAISLLMIFITAAVTSPLLNMFGKNEHLVSGDLYIKLGKLHSKTQNTVQEKRDDPKADSFPPGRRVSEGDAPPGSLLYV